MSIISVYVTHASELEAKKVANYLLEKKLIACANYFPIQSSYWWQDSVQNEKEFVSLLKTKSTHWNKLSAEIEKIHPYDTPCIIKFEVTANQGYEDWINANVI